jgi:FMN phosphatase YigB (HAD superfamily)
LLFDLGGVLLDFDFDRVLGAWAAENAGMTAVLARSAGDIRSALTRLGI